MASGEAETALIASVCVRVAGVARSHQHRHPRPSSRHAHRHALTRAHTRSLTRHRAQTPPSGASALTPHFAGTDLKLCC